MSEDRRTVDALSRELGARIYYDATSFGGYNGPRANTRDRVIHALPLDGTPDEESASFWTILHELGHIAHQHRGRDELERMLGIGGDSESEQEAQAWKWAVDHAGRPLDEIGRESIKFALSSYLYSNGVEQSKFGPNLHWALDLVGPDLPRAEVVKTAFGEEAMRNLPLAEMAWREAVAKLDIAAAA